MQTFLPYADFRKSAKTLDNQRLNKQIVECYQVLRACRGETKGWVNHPITKAWKDHETSLAKFGLVCCEEYKIKTGKDELIKKPKTEKQAQGIPGPPCTQCFNEWYTYTGTCLTCLSCGHSDSCG